MRTKTILPLGGLFAALAVTGCSNNQPPATTVVNTPAATTTTTAPGTTTTTTAAAPDTKINTNAGPGGSTGTDSATADAINTAIVHNKQMTGSRVEPVVTAGVARLNGTVQNQQQKALAGTTASSTPGVSSVINKLQIVSTGGAKAKPVVKVFNHTTVVNHYIQAPADTSGGSGGSDSTTTPAPSDSGTTSSTTSGAVPTTGGGTDTGAAPATPPASAPGGNP